MTPVSDPLTPEDRTTAMGLFNFARSYWRSSEQLRASKPDVTHPDAPILFLFYHALELYLKAFLRNAGYDLKQLKDISHRITKAGRAAYDEGLQLTADDFELLRLVDSYDNVVRSRYITTGVHSRPEEDANTSTAALGRNWASMDTVSARKALTGLPSRPLAKA
jgi:hypothetical protein